MQTPHMPNQDAACRRTEMHVCKCTQLKRAQCARRAGPRHPGRHQLGGRARGRQAHRRAAAARRARARRRRGARAGGGRGLRQRGARSSAAPPLCMLPRIGCADSACRALHVTLLTSVPPSQRSLLCRPLSRVSERLPIVVFEQAVNHQLHRQFSIHHMSIAVLKRSCEAPAFSTSDSCSGRP